MKKKRKARPLDDEEKLRAIEIARALPEWLTGGNAFRAGCLAAGLLEAEDQFYDALYELYSEGD